VKEGCKKGVDVNHPDGDSTALHCAAAGGHLEVVRCLLDHGAQPEAPLEPWYEDSMGGAGALHCAARNGHQKVVQLLLDRGVKVDKVCWWPSLLTPLHVACVEGHVNIARILLDAKADIHKVTGPGEGSLNALQLARKSGFEDVGALLLSRGAKDVRAKL